MVKKIHLSQEEIKEKISRLEIEKAKEDVQANKTKRKRIYQQLAKLQKALEDPVQLTVDPNEINQKIEADRQKRV
jgi:hypothetical protein